MDQKAFRKLRKQMYENIVEHLFDEREKILTDYPMPECIDIAQEIYQPMIDTFQKILNRFSQYDKESI